MAKSPQSGKTSTACAWALLMLVGLAGCGPSRPPLLKVSGVVTLDGKPIEGAGVMFSPNEGGRPAEGITDATGKFSLSTFAPGDGVLFGSHTVTVSLSETVGVEEAEDGLSGEVERGGVKINWIVPEKYSKRDTSGITVEVSRSLEQPVELALSSDA